MNSVLLTLVFNTCVTKVTFHIRPRGRNSGLPLPLHLPSLSPRYLDRNSDSTDAQITGRGPGWGWRVTDLCPSHLGGGEWIYSWRKMDINKGRTPGWFFKALLGCRFSWGFRDEVLLTEIH